MGERMEMVEQSPRVCGDRCSESLVATELCFGLDDAVLRCVPVALGLVAIGIVVCKQK